MSAIRREDFHIVRSEVQSEQAKTPQDQKPICDKCKDRGYIRMNVPFTDPRFGKAIKCECRLAKDKEKQQQDLLFASGILDMARFKNASFEGFNAELPGVKFAYMQCLQFAQEPQGWLVLVGVYGCGKTHLAAAIAKQCIASGLTVLIQTVPDLLDYLRSSFSPATGQSYTSRFEAMRNADLLVLDDYGAQNDTDWTTEKIFQLLNYRYNMGLPTVITSNNVTLAGIDPRIYSRLHDTSLVCLITMDNAGDYRMRNV
jgi:DNA replication protein DnaC